MREIIQYLLAIVSVGAAIFLAYLGSSILYVAAFLLFATIMVKNVRTIHAKSKDGEFRAEFGEVDSTKAIEGRDEEAVRRLRETNDGSAIVDSDDQINDELESPAR